MKASLNHVFRTIWSEALNTWIAVSEITSAKGKRSKSCVLNAAALAENDSEAGNLFKPNRRLKLRPIVFALACCYGFNAHANPVGAQVVNGSASITQSNNLLTVTNTPNAIINWQGFSIQKGEATNFVQQSASSSILNRVIGSDPSALLGTMTSNGRVFLINPAGILVGQGAKIDVAGLVASTLNLSNADYLAGKYAFQNQSPAGGGGAGDRGAIQNSGTITTKEGGSVYLVAPQVENTGIINTPKGETILAAGNTVQLMDTGTPGVSVQITGSSNTTTNLGQILTDSGRIGMVGAVVKNSGTLNANSLVSQGGKIFLKAINRVEAGGTISAQGVGGGSISVLADMQNGTVNVSGTLDASALPSIVPSPTGGGLGRGNTLGVTSASVGYNGGQIETSSAHVQVADSAKITTAAPNGKSGTWLIDPTDYTIGAIDPANGSSYMSNSLLVNALTNGNVTIQTLASGTGNGDIFISDAVSWSSANSLTLNAIRHVNINAAISNSGGASLVVRSDLNGSGVGTIIFTGGSIALSSGGRADLYYNPSAYTSPNSYTANISGGAYTAWMLVNTVTQLQAMNTNLAGTYALGKDVDATATSAWNAGAGFVPIGAFSGTFDGLNHTISNLTINRPAESNVGLFGIVNTVSVIRNTGLLGDSITGLQLVGGLVGKNSGKISNSYASGSVSGGTFVGGLVGFNNYGTGALITNSYAMGNVTGTNTQIGGLVGYTGGGTSITNSYATANVGGGGTWIGGLVGQSYGNVSNTYATGSVSGTDSVGGLVGVNKGAINISYATGLVTGTANLGGLVGQNLGAVNNSYWDITTSGQATSAGGTGKTTAEMHTASSLTGFNFTSTPGASSNNWVIVNADGTLQANASATAGATFPMLASEYSTNIANSHQLQLMAMNLGASYALGRNIDAVATNGTVSDVWQGSTFVPVGNATTKFTGIFDGLGYTINNLTINLPSGSGVGLFGFAGTTSVIRNVGLLNGNITANINVGGLVGANYGSISNSYAIDTVKGGSNGGNIGGLVGWNAGTISNSNASGIVDGNSGTGTMSGVGGLVGFNARNGIISGGFSTSVVNGGASGYYVGGLVGYNSYGTINSSFASGIVSGYAYVGGLVGYHERVTTISNSYSTGAVSGSTFVGGLTGYSYGSINNCYTTGAVSGSSNRGALTGNNGGTISNTFWNTTVNSSLPAIGSTNGNTGPLNNVVGLTSAQMQTAASFSSWNTATPNTISNTGNSGAVWRIYEGQTTPLLISFLTPITLTPTYDGTTQTSSNLTNYTSNLVNPVTSNILNTAAGLSLSSSDMAGSEVAVLNGFSSTQQGYDISYASKTITGTGSAANDLNIASALSWSSGKLVLNAVNNININANLNGSGTAILGLQYGQGAVAAGNTSNYYVKAAVSIPAGQNFSTKLGSDGGVKNFTVITNLGTATDATTAPVTATLQGIAAIANLSGNYVLGGNIDASATSTWNGGAGFAPIGSSNTGTYSGIFDGLGHTVSNLVINRPTTTYFVGVFGTVSATSAIRNVGLLGGSVRGMSYVGALVGSNSGIVSNSYATSSVVGSGGAVGGVVGLNRGAVINSYAINTVTGSSDVGGLVGQNYGTVNNSHAMSNVSGNQSGSSEIGGLIGVESGAGTVSNSYATSNVSAGLGLVGGLVGRNHSTGAITNTYATGSVNGASYVGGLVGMNDASGPISNSYASGNVTGTASGLYTYVGGLVGYNYGQGSISNTYATGVVIGTSNVGGLVGKNLGTLSNSYATGNVSGTSSNIGGLVGYNAGTISTSLWDTVTSGQSVNGIGGGTILTGATGYATAQLLLQASYPQSAGLWDFSNTWYMVNGSTRPFLRMEWNNTITNAHQLQLMGMNLAVTYTLANNLDLAAELANPSGMWGTASVAVATGITSGFAPIGNSNTPFTGTFDGLGYTISNLTITLPSTNNVGLFGYTNTAAIIQNVWMSGGSVSGNSYVGGLVGQNYGSVSNSHISGTVGGVLAIGGLVGRNHGLSSVISGSYASGTVNGTGNSVGGLVGVNNGTVSNSHTISHVNSTGNNIGGLVGYGTGSVSNSYATGSVSGNNDVGGLVGWNISSAVISGSYATGQVNATGYSVGGLAGASNGTVSNSYASGDVTLISGTLHTFGGLVGYNTGSISNSHASGNVSGSSYVGGLVGTNYGTISDAYATGSVSGNGTLGWIGGLVGQNGFGSTVGSISNSYSTGNVSGVDYVGGLLGGTGNGTVSTSYTKGSVTSAGSHVGGLMGYNNGTVSSSYWNSDVYATGIGSGTTTGTNVSGLTTAQMQTASSFTGFTFSATPGAAGSNWVIVNADGSLNSSGVSGGGTFPMLASEYSNTINNAHQLQLMAMNFGASYTLGSNIDAAETAASMDVWGSSGFVPIGNSAATGSIFSGQFDGLGHTISNLKINQPTTNGVGLFGYGSGTIKNVGLVNGNVTGSNYVGGLIGNNYGTVSNSYFSGSVSGATQVGGLVGYNKATISNSHFSGIVSGADSVGGLVGMSGSLGVISGSYAAGQVTGTSFNVGGLIGENDGAAATTYATASVSGYDNVGGLVGFNYGAASVISDSFSNGAVTATLNRAGGLVGYNGGKLNNSFYNVDTVSINGGSLLTAGGIYTNQYQDWINNGRLLNIANYTSLGLGSGGYYNVGDLQGLKDLLGFAESNTYNFRLTANIDLTNAPGFYIPYLSGVFDGANHVISNLLITPADSHNVGNNVGMFGQLWGSLTNLGVINVNVAGYHGTGGLVGRNSGGTVSNSFATGNVSSSGDGVGGLVGRNVGGAISNSYSSGTLNSTSIVYGNAGGLVGANYGAASVTNSYSSTQVSGIKDVGGLIGANYGTSTISNSYSTGSVSGTSYVGGLAGWNSGGASINNSYWNTTTSGQAASVAGGTGLTTAQMQSAVSFSGFTFASTSGATGNNWVIINADGSLNSNGVSGGGTFPMLASEYSTTINNAHQLQLMAMNLGASYTLGMNIDATATGNSKDVWGSAGFVPVGSTNSQVFTGTFDGQSHTISSLTLNRPTASETGLFGYTSGAVISNVGLVNGNVIGGVGSFSTGGTGGLVGKNGGTISASYFTGSVSGAGYVGGLVGYNISGGNISNSHAEGNVSGTGLSIGGLVGCNSAAVNNSYATANVTAPAANFVGGLVGGNNYGSVSSSYATGNVTGNSFVGGLEGYFRGTTSNSYATGAVSGSSFVGGLIGEIDFGSTGGPNILSNSYSTGRVSGTSSVGGLIGSIVAGSVSNSFWDKETSNQPTIGIGSGSTSSVIGLTTAQMKTASTFTNAGWSSSVWNMTDGSYPTLVGNAPVSTVLVDTWTGASGDWFNTSNWSLGYVPTSLTDVVINVTGLQTITLSTGSVLAKSLTCDENFTLSGGSLTVAGATTFTTGTLSQSAGTLTLNGMSSIDNFAMTGGTFNGSGSLSVTQSYLNNSGVLGATFSAINITQATGNLVVGSMGATGAIHLFSSAGDIILNGLIDAGSNAVSLTAAGAITENAGGGITTAGLSTSSSGGVTLTGANAVDSFSASESSGSVIFANAAPGLALNTIYAYGLKVLNAGGDITVNSSMMNSSGNVELLAGWDSNLTAPGVMLGTGNITLNANVASLGNLSLLAGNTISLNNSGLSLGTISITHNASWGTFTNFHSGNYISNGALALLAGGAINIGSNVGVGVLGTGNATIVAGWDGNTATPGVVSYAAGKNITINGGVGSALSGNVTLKAADAITITSTSTSTGTSTSPSTNTNNMVGIDLNSGTLSMQADKISLIALGGNGPSVSANIYSNGDQNFVLTGGSGATSKFSLMGGNGATAWGGSAQINRFGSTTGGQNFTFNNGSSLELKGGNGGGFVAAHTWSGNCDGYFGVLCSGNSANIENQAPGGQTFTFSSGSNLTLLGGSVGNSNNANISNQVGVQTIAGNPVMSITGGSSGGAMYYNNGTDPWVGADTQIQDQYLDNAAGVDSKGSQIINAASITLNGGSAAFGSAYLAAPAQTITTTGNVTLTGGTAAAPISFTSYGQLIRTDAAIIGNDVAAAPHLNIGGSLTMTGGAVSSFGGSGAIIGSLMNPADVLVTAVGNITLNAGSAFYVGTGAISLGSSTGSVAISGDVSAGTFTLSSGAWTQVASTLPNFTVTDFRITGGTFIRALGGNGSTATPYQLADIYGVQGIGSAGMLGNAYVLANNIDATGTSGWDAGAGFVPVGNSNLSFSGVLDGLGHTISNLSINRPSLVDAGLFGVTAIGSNINNIGLSGGNITGNYYVGGLVGYNAGTVSNSYTSGSVSGSLYYVGGLVGWNNGTVFGSHTTGNVSGAGNSVGGLVGYNQNAVSNSYAIGSVSGSVYAAYCVGGLVGNSVGTVSNSYANGNVSGVSYAIGGLVGQNGGTINNSYANGSTLSTSSGQVGGLVGYNGGTINYSYASGSVAGNFQLGGLVGYNYNYGTPGIINNSFWNKETTLQTAGADVGIATSFGLSTVQMQLMSSFTGWGIANTGGVGKVWRIYEGHTTPLLTSFLTPLTLTSAPDVTVSYSGAAKSGTSITLQAGVLGQAATGTNAGFYNGYYSTQQGYDITGGNLTISAASINAISLNGIRMYDGTINVDASIFTLSGLLNGETLTLSGVGTVADKNVGVNKPVSLGSLTLGNGTGLASNYTFTGGSEVATITAKPVTLTAPLVSKTYDGSLSYTTTPGTLTSLASSLIGGDTITAATLAYTDSHAGAGNKLVNLNAATINDGNGGGNYTVTLASNNFSTITPAPLTSSATIGGTLTKVYDGTTISTGSSLSGSVQGAVGGDTMALTTSGYVFNFNTSHVVGSNTISASGGTAGFAFNGTSPIGSLASDYSFTAPTIAAATGASISALPLTVSPAGIGGNLNKVYDGTALATGASLSGGAVSGGLTGQTLTLTGLTFNYNSAHVASANIISATGTAGLSISGGTAGSLPSDYSFTPPTITPVSGSISALGNYTMSGVTGNWSAPGSWLGGILPMNGDVLGITIGTNSTVTYDAAASSLALPSLTNISNAGNLVLAGNLAISNYSQTAGVLSGSGNLTVTNSFNQTGGTITLSGTSLVDITQATGNLSILSLTAPTATVNLTATTGAILGKLTAGSAILTAYTGIGSAGSPFQLVASNLTATTPTGGINLTNTPTSAVTLIDFTTGDASSVTYAQNGQDLTLTGTMSSVGGTVTMDPPVNFSMSNNAQISSAGGAIGVSATGNVVLASINAGSGAIGLTAGGNVTAAPNFTGPSLIGGVTTLNIGGNAAFSTSVQSMGGTVNGTLTVVDTGGTAFTGITGAPTVAVQQVITTALKPPINPPTPPITTDADKAAAEKAAAEKAAAAASNANGSTGTSSQNSSNSSVSTIGGTQGSFAESEPIDTGSSASAKASDATANKDDAAKKDEDSKKNNGKNNSKDKPNAKPEKC